MMFTMKSVDELQIFYLDDGSCNYRFLIDKVICLWDPIEVPKIGN